MGTHTRTQLPSPSHVRVRRQRLYRQAAPVFRRHGYHDAALKQLAHACGLSIPGLYRYFPSKRDLALYPLSRLNRPGDDCFGESDDPFVHLRVWLDHAAWERSDFLLALRLNREMADREGLADEHLETFGFHIRLAAGLLRAAAPRLGGQRARDLVESLLAMSFGSDAIGARWTPPAARDRFVLFLAPDLIRTGADPRRLRAALDVETHPAHGPCAIDVAPDPGFFR